MATTDAKSLIKANYQLILDYVEQEKWADAHRACLEILRFDPENIKVIRLKSKIENNVRKLNRDSVKKDLEMLEPLWKEKKFADILAYLQKLQAFTADYPPLLQVMKKAQEAYNQQVYEQQEDYFGKDYEQILQLIKEKKFGECLREAEKLRLLKINEPKIKKLIRKIRTDWINSEIRENQGLLQSQKYEDILLFYQRLIRIDPKSTLLENLIKRTKKDYQFYKIDEKKEFIYKSTEEIRTLFLIKKYDKAIKAAKEILDIDPRNKDIKSLYSRSQRKYHKQLEKEVIAQMLGSQRQYKPIYKENKKAFRRI